MAENALLNIIESVIAQERNRTSWNDRFTHWERPASDTEEVQIERAASMIRSLLSEDAWVASQGVEVRPQGSYFNNTNVRTESDMDLCAWHPGFFLMPAAGLEFRYVQTALGFYDKAGPTIPEIAGQLRTQIGTSLIREFGLSNVRPGKKAFRVPALPGSRADADVVPAIKLVYAWQAPLGYVSTAEGVVIYDIHGNQTINFPQLHYENGKLKRSQTRHRFKKVVRTLKWLRDELVAMGKLRDGRVPSFLIESLVYGVEDDFFLHSGDRYDRIRRVLARIWNQLEDGTWTAKATEINGIKLLFSGAQPWNVDDAKAFVLAAWARTEI